jgi:hypothetical protein
MNPALPKAFGTSLTSEAGIFSLLQLQVRLLAKN